MGEIAGVVFSDLSRFVQRVTAPRTLGMGQLVGQGGAKSGKN